MALDPRNLTQASQEEYCRKRSEKRNFSRNDDITELHFGTLELAL